MPRLLCFGLGFSARALAGRLLHEGWTIAATSRSEVGRDNIRAAGAVSFPFPVPPRAFDNVTHVLISAPPSEAGDPVLLAHAKDLARPLEWVGYLSTTGVYGDRGGALVDEDSQVEPKTDRGRKRLEAERAWLKQGLPVHLFRLAGIYGPGRNQLLSVLDGTARRIVKPGQIFSRIHVEDIAGVLAASIAHPNPGRAYNVCDDEPCPPQDVVAFAAKLLDRPPPPEIPFEQADLSPMARSFYGESKRISNRRIKEELGYRLLYPTYREGLTALAWQVQPPSARPFSR